jgi:SET domain-containing protein
MISKFSASVRKCRLPQARIVSHLTSSSRQTEIIKANVRTEGKVEVCKVDDIKGYGVIACKAFKKGELVMIGKPLEECGTRNSHSVQVDWNKHVHMDLPARLVNHSCGESNVGIRDNEYGAYNFYALSSIEAGQEVLWDYETSEFELSTHFVCSCGSPKCRGILKGYHHHGDKLKATYGEEFIAGYLKRT